MLLSTIVGRAFTNIERVLVVGTIDVGGVDVGGELVDLLALMNARRWLSGRLKVGIQQQTRLARSAHRRRAHKLHALAGQMRAQRVVLAHLDGKTRLVVDARVFAGYAVAKSIQTQRHHLFRQNHKRQVENFLF